MKAKLLMTIGVMCLAILGSAAFCADVPEFTNIIDAIKHQENAGRFLRIQAKASQVTWNDQAKSMVPASEASLIATYGTGDIVRMKLDVDHYLITWQNGPAPFLLRSFVAAYDGRIGELYLRKVGDFTKPAKISRGTLMANCPAEIQQLADKDGWRASIFGWEFPSGDHSRRFSEYLETAKKAGKLELMRPTKDGFVQVKIQEVTGHTVFSLDPARGYSIRYAEVFCFKIAPPGSTKRVVEFLFHKLDVATLLSDPSGVYYPKHLVEETFYPNEQKDYLFSQTTIDVSSLEVCPKEVSEQSFNIDFPAKTFLIDTTSKQSLVIGGDPKTQVNAITDSVRRAVDAVTTAPAAPESTSQPTKQ